MRVRRGGAASIDLLVLGTLGLAVGAMVSRAGPHNAFVALAVAALVLVTADTLLHARRSPRTGQSIGKQIFGLRVVTTPVNAPAMPLWRWCVRCMLRWPSAALSLWALSTETAHDRISGTHVVRADERHPQTDEPPNIETPSMPGE